MLEIEYDPASDSQGGRGRVCQRALLDRAGHERRERLPGG